MKMLQTTDAVVEVVDVTIVVVGGLVVDVDTELVPGFEAVVVAFVVDVDVDVDVVLIGAPDMHVLGTLSCMHGVPSGIGW